MISRAQEPKQLYAKGGTTSVRQPYFLGKAVKKIGKGLKKVVKSPLGKAALIGGGLYGLGGMQALGGKGILAGGQGLQRFRNLANIGNLFKEKALLGNLFHTGKGPDRRFSLGKAGLGALLAAGTALPFMGGNEEEEIVEDTWDVTPSSIADIRNMARNQDASLAFMPRNEYVQSGFYLKDGGRAGLMNGGGAAEAQAEQMLKMEYQKYRNQGGTMSYQQFKMTILKQAQQRGPMAQAQPQMMNQGGRIGYEKGGILETIKNFPKNLKSGFDQMFSGEVAATLGDDQQTINEFMAKNMWGVEGGMDQETIEMIIDMNKKGMGVDEIVSVSGADNKTVSEIISILNMKAQGGRIGYDNGGDVGEWYEYHAERLFGKPYHELTETELIMFKEEMGKAQGGRVGLLGGGPVPGTRVAGYTTPAGYNKFDYPSGGVRVGAANGGIMPLLDLGGKEKDYRQDGGFVGIGRKEKADDVPARLSKNEFVFTADAVRNAGGGDVDAGAEVMENMMNHLEAGGQISEESQGIGAQGMYDNMRQLETRIA